MVLEKRVKNAFLNYLRIRKINSQMSKAQESFWNSIYNTDEKGNLYQQTHPNFKHFYTHLNKKMDEERDNSPVVYGRARHIHADFVKSFENSTKLRHYYKSRILQDIDNVSNDTLSKMCNLMYMDTRNVFIEDVD